MNNLKSERGAITALVVASCLLFITTIVSVAAYIQNKVNNEDKEYLKIKSSYEKDVGMEEEIYSDIIYQGNTLDRNENITFAQKEIYVIPTGKASVVISQKFNIIDIDNVNYLEYAWATDESEIIEESSWKVLQKEKNTYTVNEEKEAGSYYLKVRINGNDVSTSKEIIVENSQITLDSANGKIVFGNSLKYNFKVGNGVGLEEAKANKQSVSVDQNNKFAVTITSGEYIYAEATDSYGNKVYYSIQN